MRKLIYWLAGLGVAYLVLAPLLTVAVLFGMLTAGVVDWAGIGRTPPEDPLTIGYRGDPEEAFGWPFETVFYETELGPAEAWLLPGTAPDGLWAIWVHGIGGLRENGYRMIEPMRAAGLPVLMISYRNDPGAPRAADGLYSFGLGEWRDLAAAVDFARERGAQQVVILAESMGAAITGQYLLRDGGDGMVAGLALDAPALDFAAVIQEGGRRYFVPLPDYVAATGLMLWPLLRQDLRAAVSLEAVAGFEGPLFVAHGTRDPLVPFAITERLLALRPDIRLWQTNADRHPMSFEEDRAGYRAALLAWLAAVRAARSAEDEAGEARQAEPRGSDKGEEQGGVEVIDERGHGDNSVAGAVVAPER